MIRRFSFLFRKIIFGGETVGFCAREEIRIALIFFRFVENGQPISTFEKNKDFILFSLCGKLGAPLLPGKIFKVESGGGGGGAVPVIRQWPSFSSSS